MARIIKPAKLDNIKKVTISAIIEKGYGGVSIAEIAKKRAWRMDTCTGITKFNYFCAIINVLNS